MKKKMKRLLIKTAAGIFASAMLLFQLPCMGARAAGGATSAGSEPQITADAAILMDANTFQICYQKNIHKQMYPASLTKIMTGILAAENGGPDDVVTVSNDVTQSQSKNYANIALLPGETVTQDELMYTMFLASANDSAQMLAEHIGGSLDHFISLMNDRARQLGALDTNFSNPNGLPDKNNVTSAYDLALITKRAIDLPALMKYFGAYSYKLPATNKRNNAETFTTLHKMMKKTKYYDKDVVAGKTGWETMSGNTLVTVAREGNRTLICVVLKSEGSYAVYTDTRALLDYGFSLSADGLNLPVANYLGNGNTSMSSKIAYAPSRASASAAPTIKAKNAPVDDTLRRSLLYGVALVAVASAAILLLIKLFERRERQSADL